MLIQERVLHAIEAAEEHYGAGEYIFQELASPQFYYQIVTGEVKLNSYKEDGKEFIHSILGAEDGFGESMLLLSRPYPMNAVAVTDCRILKVSREQFFQLLRDNPNLMAAVYETLAEKTAEKMVIMNKITGERAADRLMELINRMKAATDHTEKFSFEVPYTRQQLAALTGVSVETVIRTLKRMEKNGHVAIKNRKIYC